MKLLSVLIVTVSLTLVGCAMLTRKIPAKAEGCVEEQCGSVCAYDNYKFLPGTNLTLHRDLTCLLMYCLEDFHISFEPCSIDGSGRCHFENYDKNLTFPDCCGIKVCM